MQDYDKEYYSISKPMRSPRLPSLVPDQNTEGRGFDTMAQPIGSGPFVSFNGRKDYNSENGIFSLAPSIMFAGSDLVVVDAIREKLLLAEIPNLSMHPAVYIDDKDVWHENRWFLTFTSEFDCWDREKSDYAKNTVKVGGAELFDVYEFRLDSKVMAKTPLESRRLFKIGGTVDPQIFCHKSLSSIFSGNGESGVQLTNLEDQ